MQPSPLAVSLLLDVQGRSDKRGIALDQVGVTDLKYPITVLDRQSGWQHTVARLTMAVDLPHDFKGTHMSRFIEILNEHQGEMTLRTMPLLLEALKTRLHAARAHVEVNFDYFLERIAPQSGARALMDYDCSFNGESDDRDDRLVLGVKVPVTSVCPCSKEISDYGAHNQRGVISVEVSGRGTASGGESIIWLEELIEIAESSASAPVYPLLKRPDERHVTMQAYENPVFVEDMVRNCAVKLQADERITWFRVHATNQESIHNHAAFAKLEWGRS